MFDFFFHDSSLPQGVLVVDFASTMVTPDGDPPRPPKFAAHQEVDLPPLQTMANPDGDPPLPPR